MGIGMGWVQRWGWDEYKDGDGDGMDMRSTPWVSGTIGAWGYRMTPGFKVIKTIKTHVLTPFFYFNFFLGPIQGHRCSNSNLHPDLRTA